MRLLSVLLLVLTLFIGCSGSKNSSNELKIKVDVVKVDSWVNLMPGSTPSFFITGILRIQNDNSFDIDSLKLRLNVYQEKELIYSIKPVFESSAEQKTTFTKGSNWEFTFAVEKGLEIKKELNYDKPVDLEFIFTSKEFTYIQKTDSVHIEKAM